MANQSVKEQNKFFHKIGAFFAYFQFLVRFFVQLSAYCVQKIGLNTDVMISSVERYTMGFESFVSNDNATKRV
ncbi:hypothetical protein A6E14_04295 [Vibrio genomosp. F10]|uniref:Uncharacterized protein n=1 Tax=Vibrio genomosp. F10 TaxID=723171 RepID=A0A1B9R2V8_9VIBR|nr:hypothetical protein A6E14_04295 [Vibrio genomosp. F10]